MSATAARDPRSTARNLVVCVLSTGSIAPGCGPKEPETTPLEGTITTADGPSGTFASKAAWTYDEGGRMVTYITSQDTSCDQAAAYIDHGKSSDPSGVFAPGTCNLYLSMSGWEGSLQAEDDPIAMAGSSIECAMGDGSWSERDDDGSSTWVWTGSWWVGSPDTYALRIETVDDALVVDLRMETYNGSFSYEGTVDEADATGTVEGVVQAERCEAFANASLFEG